MFPSTTDEEILDGTATDKYFCRTEDALDQLDENPMVVADVAADQFGDGEFEVLAGVNDAVKTLANCSENIEVWTIPEGTLFDGGPVMRIKGPYREFARFETSVLGFLSQASGIATNGFRIMNEANEYNGLKVLSFGARHMHPKIAPVIERCALIAGLNGFSHVAAENHLDRKSSGTIPHALVLAIGSQEKAWRAFNESAPENTARIVISDTFTDEADEALRAANELGDDLDGVRLDTTGSRRGNFRHIIKETRWKLDDAGHQDVEIFVSGGLGPSDIQELGDIVDGFGIGGYISNADPVDFSLDIVVRDGENITKRGKLPGMKEVGYDDYGDYYIKPTETENAGLFEKVVENGEVIKEYSIDEANKNLNNSMSKIETEQRV